MGTGRGLTESGWAIVGASGNFCSDGQRDSDITTTDMYHGAVFLSDSSRLYINFGKNGRHIFLERRMTDIAILYVLYNTQPHRHLPGDHEYKAGWVEKRLEPQLRG
jgi:hypothetical protein